MLRHLRDSVQHPVSLDYFQERLSAGWKLKAIEWEKEVEAAPEAAPPPDHAAPYGLEIVPDASRLRQNPHEVGILMTILELIVVEKGVNAGEQVVTNGQLGVTPGGKVRIEQAATPSSNATK